MVAQVEFWFEYGSTYTYLSVARIGSIAARAGVTVLWKPFLLGPLFAKAGLPEGPFLPFPAKMQYMWRDLERRAKLHGLPYTKPSVYPPSTLQTARVGLIAASEGWCPEFTTAVFTRHWTQNVTIGTPHNLRDSISEVGFDPDQVLSRAEAADNKSALRSQTDEAQKLGIFGSPSFIVGPELFWGDDRLNDAISYSLVAG
jgi:2-hydroxychromene-2-carboxylate isomerase